MKRTWFGSAVILLLPGFLWTEAGGAVRPPPPRPAVAARPVAARPAAPPLPLAAARPPVVDRAASTRLSNNAKELTEALNITGQSRNLSMGLLMGKRGSLSFGNIRLDYRDKIILKSTNF